MTSSLRRKHPTTLLAAWILASVVGGAWGEEPTASAETAQEVPAAEVAPPKILHVAGDGNPKPRQLPPLERRRANIDKQIDAVRFAQFEQDVVPSEPDEDPLLRIVMEPPTREMLFNLSSEDRLLATIERAYQSAGQQKFFMLPEPIDTFDAEQAANLGPMWYQNARTGPVMRIADNRGLFPVGAAPEVSIMNESVGTPDILVALHIDLENPSNRFGLVIRAEDPSGLRLGEDVDQISANSFYAAVASADRITLSKRIAGKVTVLKTVQVEPQNDFVLAIAAFGPELAVLRDGIEVMRVADEELSGSFAGLIGLEAKEKPVTFENFAAIRYNGPFYPREFAASLSTYRGANVHFHPLYFQQLSLERYGQHLGNLVQPFIAHGMFFVDTLMLPYSFGKNPPWVCDSNIGLAKPGDVVLPFRLYFPVWDNAGGPLQIAVMALTFALVP